MCSKWSFEPFSEANVGLNMHAKKSFWSNFVNLLQWPKNLNFYYVMLTRDDWKNAQISSTAQMKPADTISIY